MVFGTLHFLSAKILRRNAELVGLQPALTISDAGYQLRLVKPVVKARTIDEKKLQARIVVSVKNRWTHPGF